MAAKNVAEVELAATITPEGTVNKEGALSESATMMVLEGALPRVRVQAVLAFEATVEGLHLMTETVTGPVPDASESVVDKEEPLRAAVMVTD